MSIFTTPISAIRESDLQELVADRAVENMQLEFKREIPTKDETLKKLSAFANTVGGFVVVGADANSKDGRITALTGVDPLAGFKQTVVQWCFSGASPPLTVEVSDPIPLSTAAGKVCYVLRVAESDLGPHFLNGRKGVYVRSDEFSSRFDAQPANDIELRQLLNRRELVRQRRLDLRRRAQQRFDTFSNDKYSELGRKPDGIGARLDLSIGPRFPANQVCDHARLLSVVEAIRISWRQVGFPRTTGGGLISQHESVIGLRPGSSFSMLEANTWGMLFYATEVELERENQYKGIHVYHFVGELLVFLEHAGLVLAKLGYDGPLTLQMRMQAIRGVPWIYVAWGNVAETGPASPLDDEVEFSFDSTTEDLKSRRDALVMDILRYAFFATNWKEAVSHARLEDYVKRGYDYNTWGTPTSLRV